MQCLTTRSLTLLVIFAVSLQTNTTSGVTESTQQRTQVPTSQQLLLKSTISPEPKTEPDYLTRQPAELSSNASVLCGYSLVSLNSTLKASGAPQFTRDPDWCVEGCIIPSGARKAFSCNVLSVTNFSVFWYRESEGYIQCLTPVSNKYPFSPIKSCHIFIMIR